MVKKEVKVDKSKITNINPMCVDCPHNCYQYNIGEIYYCQRIKEGYKPKKVNKNKK